MQNRITLKNSLPDAEKKMRSQISLIDLARLIIQKRLILTASAGIAMVIAVIIAFLIPNWYCSTASILPSGKSDKLSMFREFAGAANLPTMTDENSSLLFPDILKSNQVKDGVLRKEYHIIYDGRPMTVNLQNYFSEDNPDLLRERLDAVTSIYTDKKTGITKVSVETDYPELSQVVLSQMLAELENFNLYKRRSQAKNNERYLARELTEREEELKTAEETVEEFQNVNRDWDNSSDPEILKMVMRQKRDIEVKSRTYLLLREQHELAKLEAQKDVPIVIMLDNPSLPIIKSGPPRVAIILLTGILTLLLLLTGLITIDLSKKDIQSTNSEAIKVLRSDFFKAFPAVNRLLQRKKSAVIT